jgi:ribosomal protein S18 acetylase RimI-like enzyme
MHGDTSLKAVELRAAAPADYDFARRVHHAGMRWIGERLFGWDDAAQDAKLERQYAASEVRIIVAHGQDVGYLQAAEEPDSVFLKELHIAAAFQNRGTGSAVLRLLLAEAAGKPMTVGVVKINPARAFYERLGFRLVREDDFKFYMVHDRGVSDDDGRPASDRA